MDIVNAILDVLARAWSLVADLPIEMWVILAASVWTLYATHFVKRSVLPARWRRRPWVVRLVAIAAAIVPMLVFWPNGPMRGAFWGVTVGMFWAMAYKPAVLWLYNRWPALQDKLSANPD